jgi:methionyl-tRNA formyltransferase
MRCLFLTKAEPYADRAADFASSLFDTDTYYSEWGEQFPDDLLYWQGDIIVSFSSRWIVPPILLKQARTAINFHPGSSYYPGIGGYNFALYEQNPTYGAGCHFMQPLVDTGEIIQSKSFQVFPWDNVESLIRRTYDHMLVLLYDVLTQVAHGESLKPSGEQWQRKPISRQEFNNLGIIDATMHNDEIMRRQRACRYRDYGLTAKIGERLYKLSEP